MARRKPQEASLDLKIVYPQTTGDRAGEPGCFQKIGTFGICPKEAPEEAVTMLKSVPESIRSEVEQALSRHPGKPWQLSKARI